MHKGKACVQETLRRNGYLELFLLLHCSPFRSLWLGSWLGQYWCLGLYAAYKFSSNILSHWVSDDDESIRSLLVIVMLLVLTKLKGLSRSGLRSIRELKISPALLLMLRAIATELTGVVLISWDLSPTSPQGYPGRQFIYAGSPLAWTGRGSLPDVYDFLICHLPCYH